MVGIISAPKKPTYGSILKIARDNQKTLGYLEAGDLGHEVGKGYREALNDMRASHARLKGIYYIYAVTKSEAYAPESLKVVLCSGREEHRCRFRPQWGCDLWKINNDLDTEELVWSLPSQETVGLILRNPSGISSDLVRWIKLHRAGMLV